VRTDDLPDVLALLGRPRLLVVGDLLLDRYTCGPATRISPEAPVPVLDACETEERAGGAAAVAVLAVALGARVRLAGVLGPDAAGRALRCLLEEAGVESLAVVSAGGRPTSVKERFLAESEGRRPQHLLRVDRECRGPLGRAAEDALLHEVVPTLAEHDAVLLADYGKGVCGRRLLKAVSAAALLHGVPVLVDPARGADWCLYRGAALLAPNRTEAGLALRHDIRNGRDALAAGRRLLRRLGAEAVLVKLDREGMALVEAGEPGCLIPAWSLAAEDVAGAGDLVLRVSRSVMLSP
jgi:D-beta-D-heptose 7-phosphate kinase/D-beta-D-heptose 1-phosphate adenosyltransferase